MKRTEEWVQQNRLIEARDRGRLGDVNVDPNTHAIRPPVTHMVTPMITPVVPKMVRPMGESTVQAQRDPLPQRGNPNLWADTPIAGMPDVLGDPEIIDVGQILAGWDRVGWEWDRRKNCLIAFISKGHKTWRVKIPLRRLQRIVNAALQNDGSPTIERQTSLNGLFKKLGRGLKKAVKKVGKSVKGAVTAPVRFVKNPRKFVSETARKIKNTVRDVGRTGLKVVSSPVFGGIMAGMAAVPPLTAIGGAGLAAMAAARAARPAIMAADAASGLLSGKGKGKIANLSSRMRGMPPGARNMMTAALKSIGGRGGLRLGNPMLPYDTIQQLPPASELTREQRRRRRKQRMKRRIKRKVLFRLQQGRLKPIGV